MGLNGLKRDCIGLDEYEFSENFKKGSNKQSRVNLKLNLSIFQITTFKNK